MHMQMHIPYVSFKKVRVHVAVSGDWQLHAKSQNSGFDLTVNVDDSLLDIGLGTNYWQTFSTLQSLSDTFQFRVILVATMKGMSKQESLQCSVRKHSIRYVLLSSLLSVVSIYERISTAKHSMQCMLQN